MSAGAVLELRGISAGYGRTQIVNEVSLVLPEGRRTGLIGPNGHGKTTLLNAAVGLIRPWAGTVRWGGRDVTRERLHRLVREGLGYVPQGDLLFDDLSVEDNLRAAAQGSAWRDRSGRMKLVVELFPILGERRTQRASTLSGGERRMVAIGRALMREVRVLILDEPSLGLAPRVVEQVYKAIDELAEAGMTTLVVEENPDRLRGHAEAVLLFEAGRVVRAGTIEEVLADDVVASTYFGRADGPYGGGGAG